MTRTSERTGIAEAVGELARRGFQPRFGQLRDDLPTHALWDRLRELGTELWLDTGSTDDAAGLWTRELTALTTNNTLLNREVQKGTYDGVVAEAARLLAGFGLTAGERVQEVAFLLNALHGLKLVERFDAFVSVELHTALAHDADAAVAYARRYHAVCPERFLVKIPLTPAGLLATRRLADEGVPVNHTLGFSARQNYVVARIGRPAFVNVFMGRLGVFVADNGLGDGSYVGERATLASQAAVRELRKTRDLPTRQIGASFRAGEQVRDLAGMDVMTLPPKVARQFLDLGLAPAQVTDRTGAAYEPPLADGVDPRAIGLNTLWDIPDRLIACVDALERQNLDAFTADDVMTFFAGHGCGDLFPRWTEEQIAAGAAEGKIPRLATWSASLAAGEIGLDALMNLAGLLSFTADQHAMDDRIAGLMGSDLD